MAKRICSIGDCEDPVRARGWCGKHWKRWQRHGDPLAGRAVPQEAHSCRHPDGCPRPARKLGWCTMHYQRVCATGDAGPVGRLRREWGSVPDPCTVDGCGDTARYADGYCDVHHQRVRKYGEPGPAALLKRRLPKEVRTWTDGQRHRFYKYGLTPEAFDAMLAEQGGRCYVCGTDAPGGKGWSVDHCHKSGAVRFIACNPCNAALGLVREDPRIALRLYEVTLELQANGG